MNRLVPLALLPIVGAAPALATPSMQLYERALMIEIDRRCSLFTPEVRSALSVGRIQARNAAARAGSETAGVERRARLRAAALPCASPNVHASALRVREAHAGWARLSRMTFAGPASAWRADRTLSDEPRWRVVQTAGATSFGLAGAQPGASDMYAVARFPRDDVPALARLSVGRHTYLAASRDSAPPALAGPGKGRAWAFRFPPSASDALAAAAVRDTAAITFIHANGASRATPLEIGDFAAARAFVRP